MVRAYKQWLPLPPKVTPVCYLLRQHRHLSVPGFFSTSYYYKSTWLISIYIISANYNEWKDEVNSLTLWVTNCTSIIMVLHQWLLTQYHLKGLLNGKIYTTQNLLRISFLTLHISVLSLTIHLYEDLIIVYLSYRFVMYSLH